jgi:hypothetical protein
LFPQCLKKYPHYRFNLSAFDQYAKVFTARAEKADLAGIVNTHPRTYGGRFWLAKSDLP